MADQKVNSTTQGNGIVTIPLVERFIKEVSESRKYRKLTIPVETLQDLLDQELAKGRNASAALQSAREKLHNIIAPYLGDPDYAAAALKFSLAGEDSDSIKAICLEILEAHASTRERIPILDNFYEKLWSITGIPTKILDLACGLHPFGLPWMGLPVNTQYYAYDIHGTRIGLVNDFLKITGREPLGYVQDILVNPPEVAADVALFFKEAHRFEQRQKGCNRPFFEAIRAHWLLVSLPAVDLSGHHSLIERQRRLMDTILSGLDWPVTEMRIDDELIYCIRKP